MSDILTFRQFGFTPKSYLCLTPRKGIVIVKRARGGIRTPDPLQATDFKSGAYATPPLSHKTISNEKLLWLSFTILF